MVAGCGGSSGGDSTASGQTVTIPGDVHGFFDEQEAIFGQFPYQHWYAACLRREAEAILTPEEAEEIDSEPQAEREERTNQVVSEASGRCEQSGRPAVDPNASAGQLALLRAATLGAVVELAETQSSTGPGRMRRRRLRKVSDKGSSHSATAPKRSAKAYCSLSSNPARGK